MERRHAIRRIKDGLWEVYDIDDEMVVFVGDVPLTNLQDEEALDALELLKDGFLLPRSRGASSRRS
ncbi:hypothetical protein C9427_04845 [Mesorhizobium helmanticense]|uniref:Uncharacterized protein n=1 Tax=Mesorhizobium helmanticense TaxID=1776423 RepID=A0A2T4J0X1_9HYPH|nr:hypothetical protein C9427_04845 [Mesorhizobium helmanticense]